MVSNHSPLLHDRSHAASLLAERLMAYQNTNAVVVAIPCGGVPIGYHLSRMLNLPLEIVNCRKLKGPSSSRRSIGSVSTDYVITHDELRDIPQNYFAHQVKMLRQVLTEKEKLYRGGIKPISLRKRTVILVDDELTTGDTLIACLGSMQKHAPEKIVVGIPLITPEAYYEILPLVDEVVYLFKSHEPPQNVYHAFPRVTDEEVRNLFALAHKEYLAYQYVM